METIKRLIVLFVLIFLLFSPLILPGAILYIGLVKHNYEFVKTLALILAAGFFLALSFGSIASNPDLRWDSLPNAIISILIFFSALILLGLFINFLISHGYYPWWLR